MKCLVLDAMGVIFQSADDVAELGIDSILFAAESGFTDLQRRLSSRISA